jgi:hypothetical protein
VLPLYLEVRSRIEAVGEVCKQPPFGRDRSVQVRCSNANREGRLAVRTGVRDTRGHCRAVVVAGCNDGSRLQLKAEGSSARDWRWDGMFGPGRGSKFTWADRRVAYWKPGPPLGLARRTGGCKVSGVMMVGLLSGPQSLPFHCHHYR